MHFIHFDLTFGVFERFWGFSKLMRFLQNFWVRFCLNDLKCSYIASHLHFHNVLWIIDVCLLCWIKCVLVGLDWAEPMTFLSLHFTCLCCFHAYAPSFLYLLILNFLGTLLCVSLSLSFFRLVCSMAPKKSKSTPSQNPLHSRVASSFDSTPSLVRFCDDKAHKDFLENFSRRGIHSKRQVVLSDFSDTDLPTVIYSRG